MKRKTVVSFLLTLLLMDPLFAHKPLFDAQNSKNVIYIDDPDISRVVYHDVKTDGDRIWITFDGKEGEEVYISIGVPVIDRLKEFRPALALLGKGLPRLNDLPVELPIETGYFFQTDSIKEPRFFHEHFTGTDSWIILEQRIILPVTGTYYLLGITYDKETEYQKFWVSIGDKESFGLVDLFKFFDWKKRVRAFHESD